MRLFASSISGQAILLAGTPLLTRTFDPEDFAALVPFVAATGLVSVLLHARFDLAVTLDGEDEEAMAVLVGALALTVTGGVILGALLHTLGPALLATLGLPDSGGWIKFVTLGSANLAWWDLISRWQARQNRFKTIARANIMNAGVVIGSQLLLGFLVPQAGASNLVVGWIIGRSAANLYASRTMYADYQSLKNRPNCGIVRSQLRRHWRFAAFTLPQALISKFTHSFMAFSLGIFGEGFLGQYGVAQRMIARPTLIISGSISPVLYPVFANMARSESSPLRLLIHSYVFMTLLSLPIVGAIYFFGEDIFAWVLGENWREAGRIARYLLPMIVMQFIVSPSQLALHASGHQFAVLMWAVSYLVITITTFQIFRTRSDPDLIVLAFSLGTCAMYLVYLGLSLALQKRSRANDHCAERKNM